MVTKTRSSQERKEWWDGPLTRWKDQCGDHKSNVNRNLGRKHQFQQQASLVGIVLNDVTVPIVPGDITMGIMIHSVQVITWECPSPPRQSRWSSASPTGHTPVAWGRSSASPWWRRRRSHPEAQWSHCLRHHQYHLQLSTKPNRCSAQSRIHAFTMQ